MPRLQKFVECLGTALCEYATAALARLVPFETALLEVARSLAPTEPAFAVECARILLYLELHRSAAAHRLGFRQPLQLFAGHQPGCFVVSAPFAFVAQRELHAVGSGFESVEIDDPLSFEPALGIDR